MFKNRLLRRIFGHGNLKYVHFQCFSPNDTRIQNPETITVFVLDVLLAADISLLFSFSFNIRCFNLLIV